MDKRILKTKRAIKNAYAELLSYKNINDITIKDIADGANISRKTFYFYYQGIWEIDEEIANDISNMIEESLNNVNFKEDIKEPYIIFEKISDVINTDLDFFSIILSNENNSTLIKKIEKVLEDKFIQSFKDIVYINDTQLRLLAKYSITGILAIYQDWFNSNRKIPIDEISKELGKVIMNGMEYLIIKDED